MALSVDSESTATRARRTRELARLVGELSGYAVDDLDPSATFFQLGFDSLFLAQLSASVQQRYGVGVTFRQLFEEIPTIAALSSHVSAELPPETVSPDSDPTPPRSERVVPSAAGDTAVGNGRESGAAEAGAAGIAGAAGVTSGGFSAGGLSRIVSAQMRLMDEHLRLLDRAARLSPEARESLRGTKRLVERRRGEMAASASRLPVSTFPLTDSQSEIWLASQISPQVHTAYNESETLILEGNLDVAAFRRAIVATLARHEALHLRFAADGSAQWVDELSRRTPEVELEDFSDLSTTAREQRLRDKIRRLSTDCFDMEHGPIHHAAIVRLSDSLHHFVFFAHHLAYDGWSASVLIDDISEHYAAYLDNRDPRLPPAGSYRNFVATTLRNRDTDPYRDDLDYWKHRVDKDRRLELPTDVRRDPVRRGHGATVKHRFDDAFYRAVNEAARTLNTSKFNLLITLFAVLLRRLSGQAEQTVGVSVAAQATLGFPTLIGHCVNLLPLQLSIHDVSLEELLGRVREEFLRLYDHNRCTLGSIIEDLDLHRDTSRTPVVEAIFNFSQYNAALDLPGLDGQVVENPKYSSHCDLFAKIREDDGFMTADWDYNASIFSAETVSRWIRCLETLALALLAEPASGVLRAPMLADADRSRLMRGLEGTRMRLPRREAVHGAIGRVARDHPEAPAVSDGARSLTYRQLWARSGGIAASLAKAGAAPGDIIGVCLDRRLDLVPTLLAVWRVGCAYLPLDPTLPEQRLEFMLADSGCDCLITSRDIGDRLSDQVRTTLYLDDVPTAPWTDLPADPEALAYVMYTSGSTGKPKGVCVTHRNVVNLLSSMRDEPGFTERDVLLAVTTTAFDISVLELFLPLITGGLVVVASRRQASDGVLLGDLIDKAGATVMQATPATWQLLIESGWEGQSNLRALCGGEALSPALASELGRRVAAAWNMYGPTETTIWSTLWRITPASGISIGHPVANTSVLVLDENLRLVPAGVRGEIYIGGEGVARGYLNQPNLTHERFVLLPESAGERTKAYATGDIGYYRDDGNLVYVGRGDSQVKVRGHRIELGEIEAVLADHPHVMECAVVLGESSRGDAEIVGYVSTSATLGRNDVTSHLRRFLPEYMLPHRVVFLDELPKTPNNKLDRNALKTAVAVEPQDAAERAPDGARPHGVLEAALLAIWRAELGRENVEVGDDFVDIGGHSLVAARIVSRLRELIDTSIYIVAIYDTGTVERLADYLIEHYPNAVYRTFPELSRGATASLPEGNHQVGPPSLDDRAIRQFRALVPSIPLDSSQAERPNRRAVFLLSAPRSGSTLTRVMMGGSPGLFSPPELYLMSFNTMRERHEYLRDHWNEAEAQGLVRALMELQSWDAATAEDYVAAHVAEETTISSFCASLQEMVGARLLVDKTPDYAYDPNTLARIESWFRDPLYIHLVRHPAGMMSSFHKLRLDRFSPYRDRFSAEQIAELNWFVANDNITRFLVGVPPERRHFLRFEDLLERPERESRRLCRFLDVPFDAEMLDPYAVSSGRMSDGIDELSVATGDPRFHEHAAIDASVADAWKQDAAGIRMSARTRELARSYDYLGDEAVPEPIRFGAQGELFGVYHPPVDEVAKPAVVICPPILLEYLRAHRCLRQLALALSHDGYPVLRFDYAGTGDSAGDLRDFDPAAWLSNVATAIDEARQRSGARRVCLVGVRMGALLAALAADGRADVAGLVLWDPVLAGDRFLEQLALVQQELVEADPRFGDGTTNLVDDDELVGFEVPAAVREKIAALGFRSFGGAGSASCRVAVVTSQGEDTDAARAHLQTMDASGGATAVDYDCHWTRFTGTVLFPHEILKAIAHQLDGLVQHGKTVPIREESDAHRDAVHA